MTDAIIKLIKSGVLYLHGRCMDHCPIIVLNFAKLSDQIRNKEINNYNFCALHNFYVAYIMKNMLVPGQVEKWITIANLN